MSLQSVADRTNNCSDADSHHTCSCYPHFHIGVMRSSTHVPSQLCVHTVWLSQVASYSFSTTLCVHVFNIRGDFQKHNPLYNKSPAITDRMIPPQSPTYTNSKRWHKLLNKVQRVRSDGGFAHCPSVLKSNSEALCKPLSQLSRYFLIPVLSEPHHLDT